MLKLMETQIPQNYSAGLYNEKAYDLRPEACNKIMDILVNSVTACLADIKSKSNPTAFIFEENNEDFIAAAVIEYIENEDPSQAGSWNYYWTFSKDDVPENSRKVTAADANMSSYFRGTAQAKYSFGFINVEAINEVCRYLMKQISKWLDDNASETEEVGVEQEGVFQARVAVENGEKVKSIEVAGEIKRMIKDDAAIEVA